MTVAVRHVLRQEVDELRRRELTDYPLLEHFIFHSETHIFWCNFFKSMLRDGKATSVTPCILQEVSLELKIIHVNALHHPVLVCKKST